MSKLHDIIMNSNILKKYYILLSVYYNWLNLVTASPILSKI